MNPTSDMAINVTNQIAVTRVVAITGVSAMLALIQVPELRAALFHSLMFLSMVVSAADRVVHAGAFSWSEHLAMG